MVWPAPEFLFYPTGQKEIKLTPVRGTGCGGHRKQSVAEKKSLTITYEYYLKITSTLIFERDSRRRLRPLSELQLIVPMPLSYIPLPVQTLASPLQILLPHP